MDGDDLIKKGNWSWGITSEKGVIIKQKIPTPIRQKVI